MTPLLNFIYYVSYNVYYVKLHWHAIAIKYL